MKKSLTFGLLGVFFIALHARSAHAQEISPRKMLEAQVAPGKTIDSLGKEDFLTALCAAVKKFRASSPQIASISAKVHPEWRKDILTTSFHCLGNGDCALLGQVLHAISPTKGAEARDFTKLAMEVAPDCGPGHGGTTDGNFGNPPGAR